jgi:hypothetical protein
MATSYQGGLTVTHYNQTRWIDFVSDRIPDSARQVMEAHLGKGCSRCRCVGRLLQACIEVADADSQWGAPGPAVHTAKAVFALLKLERVYILPGIAAKLVYDGFRDPLPAGLRTQHHISRQALYEAGRYCVDLRLERESGSRRIHLVGQVADREQREPSLGEVPVLLMSGKAVIARTVSNMFGEFQMEYEPAQHLHLHVRVEQRANGSGLGRSGRTSRSGEDD